MAHWPPYVACGKCGEGNGKKTVKLKDQKSTNAFGSCKRCGHKAQIIYDHEGNIFDLNAGVKLIMFRYQNGNGNSHEKRKAVKPPSIEAQKLLNRLVYA